MYGGWVGGELLWGEHTSSEFNHLRSRVAQGQGACLPSSLNALMICLSIYDDYAVVWHIWFRGDALAASAECAMSVCHWERYVQDACLSPKNVTARNQALVWISGAVVVIVLVFLLTVDCRKKEGDSLG